MDPVDVAYSRERDYDFLPTIKEVDTGAKVLDHPLAALAGTYNHAALVVNTVSNGVASVAILSDMALTAVDDLIPYECIATGRGIKEDLFVLSLFTGMNSEVVSTALESFKHVRLFARAKLSTATGNGAKPGTYRPAEGLPRTDAGVPKPSSEYPHTQLGTQTSRKAGDYTQAREWGYDANRNLEPKRVIDFTDHVRPAQHPNPHYHDYVPNPTGGTPQHGPAMPFEW